LDSHTYYTFCSRICKFKISKHKHNKAIEIGRDDFAITKDEKVDKSKKISESSSSINGSNDGNATIEEIYYPVECLDCGTKVAVMDVEEVYHFFNAIPS